MAHYNPLESSLQHFATLAREHGWTEEEILDVAKKVYDDVRRESAHRSCRVSSILEKHARPVIERKKREQENKED